MDRFEYTKKSVIRKSDKESLLIKHLESHFEEHPSQNLSFLHTCIENMQVAGYIPGNDYNTLVSIWKYL